MDKEGLEAREMDGGLGAAGTVSPQDEKLERELWEYIHQATLNCFRQGSGEGKGDTTVARSSGLSSKAPAVTKAAVWSQGTQGITIRMGCHSPAVLKQYKMPGWGLAQGDHSPRHLAFIAWVWSQEKMQRPS